MPPPVSQENIPCCLVSFILRRRVPSPIAVLPTKSTSRMRTFGPSCTSKVTLTSLGPPGSVSTFEVISANWKPFSAIISWMMPFTRRTAASSRNESRRSVTPSSFIFSSILVRSTLLDPV